jgi:hypothetical protein
MYTKEDLQSLGEFLRLIADEALKQEPPNEEDSQDLMEILRQLEAIRYNPLLFQDVLESYEVDYALMVEPLDQVALHINDAGIISKTLVQWRCTNGL